ncbi:MAG: peptide deformylase [Planctomycetota bacterium]
MPVDPATLRIVLHPAEVLRQKADPVGKVTEEVRQIASRMLEVMRSAEGIGLAAPQVGLPWRMFVCDVPTDPDEPAGEHPIGSEGPEVHIDPVVIDPEGGAELMEEGCLSLPGIRGEVPRPPIVTVESTNLKGERAAKRAAGLLARCWQHEIDHLDGVLILDRFTQMSRLKTRSQVRNLEKSRR